MSATPTPTTIEVAEADFGKLVLDASRTRPVVVDFWAPWCGPCRALGPILERLVNERGGQVLLAKVNIDEAQGLAEQYGIESIPAVISFRDGQPGPSFVGLLPEDQLREFLDQISPTEADQLARDAQQKEVSSPQEAEALFRKALALDANHQGALVGMVRLLLARGEMAEAESLLTRANEGGDQGDEVERLETLLSLRKRAQEFGTEPALRQRLAQEPANAQFGLELGSVVAAAGRYAEALQLLFSAAERDPKLAEGPVRELMVKIFHIVGVRSPLADEYRAKLSRLLY